MTDDTIDYGNCAECGKPVGGTCVVQGDKVYCNDCWDRRVSEASRKAIEEEKARKRDWVARGGMERHAPKAGTFDSCNTTCCMCGHLSKCPNDFRFEGRQYCRICFFDFIAKSRPIVHESLPDIMSGFTAEAMEMRDWNEWIDSHPPWEGYHWAYYQRKDQVAKGTGGLWLLQDDGQKAKAVFTFRNCPTPPLPKYDPSAERIIRILQERILRIFKNLAICASKRTDNDGPA